MVSNLIALILFAFGTACFSEFLQLCFMKGMIFRKYYSVLSVFCYKRNLKWLWKIGGGCVYCQSVYVFIGFYLFIIPAFSEFVPALVGLFLGIGINYFWIEIIEKVK